MPTRLAACLVFLISANAFAAGPVLRAGLGYTHMFEVGDPDLDPAQLSGGGIDLFGGWQLDFGLVPELQVGFHLLGSSRREHGFDVETLWTVTPVLAGARYSVPLSEQLRAHIAAHVGIVHEYWERELLGVRGSGSATRAGFNVGLGGDFMLDERFSIGGAAWYGMVISRADVEDSGNGHMISVAAHVSLAL